MTGPYTDSHAHLSMPGPFDADRDAAWKRARAAGVGLLLDLATSPAEFDRCTAFAASREGVHAALGVHPHEAVQWTGGAAARIREAGARHEIVAVGEIGLDYHYDHSPRDVQRRAMAEQLQLAAELSLPVSVHSREAEEDTVELLSDSDVRRTGGVLHCFTGSETMARSCLDLGMHVSFSGIVTFANADRLRGIAAWIPEDRLLIETDSPYLAPVPHRGGRNEPARVVDVARCVAGVRGVDEGEIARATTAAFRALFLRPAAPQPPQPQ